MAPQEPETLSKLVGDRAGKEGSLTFLALSERCVDPEGGYRPSANLLWKIAKGQEIKVNPELIRAIATGTGLPLKRVQAAAAYQFTGYVATELGEGVVLHEPGVGGDFPKARAVLEHWAEEEGS
ncbi:hypothetical protein I5Q34_30925 [Streptomyces sp. AV19]|uniref:hypothetical protein n=1 Tax=Streptomyces sp. AV19 TaxID=2793068 RepID=UPI0018FE1B1A|nr:hypothetical protein [Streptomyces sp. AV19]MBH1938622.1 hypothetical protein [Streptomyces sp. AV19]MDG4535266.1 hypothetical protein [Streptomyces sp. AV19]